MRALALLAGFMLVFTGWALFAPKAEAVGTRWDVVGGPIGDRGEGWHVIRDGHSVRHLRGVTCRGRYLEVRHTVGLEVPIWSVDTDEHLLDAGIHAGVSATKSEARVFFYRNGEPISCHHSAFNDPLSNIWMHGSIELLS